MAAAQNLTIQLLCGERVLFPLGGLVEDSIYTLLLIWSGTWFGAGMLPQRPAQGSLKDTVCPFET